ncbi:MAG: hypothetical protein ABW199_06480, partial [Caulobacterales bacterium]
MSASRFARLIDLAKANDGDQRRELLRDVTDLFFETRSSRSATESALFGDVLQLVAAEMPDGVLVDLSNRFATAADAPTGLVRDLANHNRDVAAPILRSSPVLSDHMLMQIVKYQSQHHIKAVA